MRSPPTCTINNARCQAHIGPAMPLNSLRIVPMFVPHCTVQWLTASMRKYQTAT